jgi:predicted Fe-S protein YdhL (DUF1289 family)
MTEAPVASPCVRNCCLDDDDICLGCHRSIEEIIAWGPADSAERRAILERAARRKQAQRARYPGSLNDF